MNSWQRILLLIKIFFKSGSALELEKSSWGRKKSKKQKAKWYSLITYALLGIYLPFIAVLYGKGLFPPMIAMGQDQNILNGLLEMFFMITIIYGFFFTFSTLAFSKDQDRLMAMPIPFGEIMIGRFAFITMHQMLLPLVLGLPLLATYGYYKGASWVFYAKAFCSVILLPVFPVAILVIICIFLMRLTKIARNKDRFMTVAQIVILILVLVFALGSSALGLDTSGSPNLNTNAFSNNSLGFLKYIFVTLGPLLRFLTTDGWNGLLCLAIILVMTIASILVAFIVAQKFFRPGQNIGMAKSSRKKNKSQSKTKSTQKSPFAAFAQREWRLLLRNPNMMINYFVGQLIVPLAMVIPLLINPSTKQGMGTMLKNLKPLISSHLSSLQGEDFWLILALACLGTSIIGYVFCGHSTMNNSAISREGSEITYLMVMPVSYQKQFLVKSLFSIAVSGTVFFLILIAGIIFFAIPVRLFILPLITYVWATVNANLVSLLIDCSHPVLDWENEIYPIKKNKTVLFSLLLNMILGTIFGLIIYFSLKEKTLLTPEIGLVLGLALNTLLTVLLIFCIRKSIKKTMQQIENFL